MKPKMLHSKNIRKIRKKTCLGKDDEPQFFCTEVVESAKWCY